MGKVYGKNASDSTQLIIDGDAIDQRLSTLEANWNSIAQTKYGVVTSGSVPSKGSTATQITFDSQFSEPPCVFIQDRSGGRNPSDMINNKTIVSDVTSDGFTARSFNNTSTTFPTGMTFYWMAIGK